MTIERVIAGIVYLLMAWLVVGAWRLRRKRVTVGPAAAASMHELLNQDTRAAVEIGSKNEPRIAIRKIATATCPTSSPDSEF